MTQLTWICAYETIKFDTPDGDLHRNQYAYQNGTFFVRDHPENNHQHSLYYEKENSLDFIKALIQGKTQVQILDGQHMYYEEFALPNSRIIRLPISAQDYENIKNGQLRQKAVTDIDITNFQKDDSLWQ